MHWDITTEEILRLHEAGEAFFNPILSYEITKYRPINATQGLDFDPTPFTEVGKRYDSTKKFCTYPTQSKAFKDWWENQHRLCDKGLEVDGYRVTGDHYFFLNFYTMLKSEAGKKAGSGRKDGRPEFWAAHYEFFHYIELCEVLGYDSVILKARGVGASEIAASLGVRPYTTTKGYNALYVAYALSHLEAPKGVLGKCWKQLDWLNQNTGGGMRRVRMGKNDDFTKKACMKDKTGEESGHMAIISGQVVDRPDKLRGDRVDRLFFEESGSNPCLGSTWIVGEALVIINGRRHGCRVAWGCVCKGTKVWNNQGDFINIENVIPENGILGFDQETGKVSKESITYWQPPAKKPCYRITTHTSRTLECSEDHPILYSEVYLRRGSHKNNKKIVKFKETKDLKLGDQVAIVDEVPIFGTKKMWEPRLVGWLIGDGSYGFDKTPVLSNCEEEILNYVKANFDYKIERSYTTKLGKEYNELRIKGICHKLRELGIYGQTRGKKTLPKDIHSYTKEDICEVLGGFFDTDGSICVNSKRIVIDLSCAYHSLMLEVKMLLMKLGIHGSITKIKKKENNPLDRNDYYRFVVADKDSVLNFHKHLKFYPKNKQVKLDSSVDHFKNKTPKRSKDIEGIRYERITNIEFLGEQDVYNLTAGVTNTYIANGIITHNTGGSEGPYLEGLEKMFLDPITFGVLPYKHKNTIKGDTSLTGYFLPAWATVMDHMDKRGVVDEEKAKAYYNKIRDVKRKDFNTYSKYCAEYCFYPEEALSRQGNNNFDQEKLADQYTEITFNKSTPIVKHGYTKWDYEKDANNNSTSRVIGAKFIEASNGNTHILEMPVLDDNNQHIKDLYVAGIDSIDKALGDSMDDKGSKFCVTIKKRTFGMEGDKYVAYYMDRPYDIREAYEKCAQLLTMYNCKANLEDTKIGIIGYYREKHWLHLLMKRPQYAIQGDSRRPPNAFGTQGTEKMILHAIDLIDAYIKDYCHLIGFVEMIEQLQNYSWEKKGKYDLVASMGMCEIGDEELMGIVPKKELIEIEGIKDIGFYYENGKKKYGIIPDKNNNKHLNAALNGYNQF